MRILLLVRSTRPFRSQRVDFDHVIDHLEARGHAVFIYDPRQRLFMDCARRTSARVGSDGAFWRRGHVYRVYNFAAFLLFVVRHQWQFDVCHVLYVREEYLIAQRLVTRLANRTVATLYGSDVNLQNPVKRIFTGFYRRIDAITATNRGFLNQVIERYRLHDVAPRARVLMFPQVRLNRLNHLSDALKRAAKEGLGFEPTDTVVVLGTNAWRGEQHLAIADALASSDTPTMLVLVFPLTYGAEPAEKLRLRDAILSRLAHRRTVVISEELSEDELARLRLASDVFVNLRRVDQFAASMLESFAAGAEVVTGSWLPYQDLDDAGFVVDRVQRVSDLPQALAALLGRDAAQRQQIRADNRRLVWERYDPARNLADWLAFYEGLSDSPPRARDGWLGLSSMGGRKG